MYGSQFGHMELWWDSHRRGRCCTSRLELCQFLANVIALWKKCLHRILSLCAEHVVARSPSAPGPGKSETQQSCLKAEMEASNNSGAVEELMWNPGSEADGNGRANHTLPSHLLIVSVRLQRAKLQTNNAALLDHQNWDLVVDGEPRLNVKTTKQKKAKDCNRGKTLQLKKTGQIPGGVIRRAQPDDRSSPIEVKVSLASSKVAEPGLSPSRLVSSSQDLCLLEHCPQSGISFTPVLRRANAWRSFEIEPWHTEGAHDGHGGLHWHPITTTSVRRARDVFEPLRLVVIGNPRHVNCVDREDLEVVRHAGAFLQQFDLIQSPCTSCLGQHTLVEHFELLSETIGEKSFEGYSNFPSKNQLKNFKLLGGFFELQEKFIKFSRDLHKIRKTHHKVTSFSLEFCWKGCFTSGWRKWSLVLND
ncbi:hypothetical protein C8F04DRAFT_1236094 [Mycena alexandri]|uniref:Uncharacterized protein n=1 Tax=Mycena alexandri TaxID=1745969 RepID=A0AAD6SRJ2_9AGAR|nr:hypothetical protein C8F04DRAFT_1236094 [Mycena alexandri]